MPEYIKIYLISALLMDSEVFKHIATTDNVAVRVLVQVPHPMSNSVAAGQFLCSFSLTDAARVSSADVGQPHTRPPTRESARHPTTCQQGTLTGIGLLEMVARCTFNCISLIMSKE